MRFLVLGLKSEKKIELQAPVLYLPVHSPGVWCIAIGATHVMDPWMHERHCGAGIGTSIKICEIGLL